MDLPCPPFRSYTPDMPPGMTGPERLAWLEDVQRVQAECAAHNRGLVSDLFRYRQRMMTRTTLLAFSALFTCCSALWAVLAMREVGNDWQALWDNTWAQAATAWLFLAVLFAFRRSLISTRVPPRLRTYLPIIDAMDNTRRHAEKR